MHFVACTGLEELILWVACVFEERFIYTLHIMGAGRARNYSIAGLGLWLKIWRGMVKTATGQNGDKSKRRETKIATRP